jgi:hypothetical protein
LAAILNDLAIDKLEDTLALIGYSRVMRDNQDRRIQVLVELVDKLQDFRPRCGVEISRRLVREEDRGIDGKGTRYRNALAFAARKLVREVIHAVVKVNHLEKLFGPCLNFVEGPVTKVQWQSDIFKRTQRGEEIEELKDESDFVATDAREIVIPQAREVLTLDLDCAGGRTIQPSDQVQQCGLPGSGRADDRHQFTAFHLKAYIFQSLRRSLALKYLRHLRQRDHQHQT